MDVRRPDIDDSWYEVLKDEFASSYFSDMKSFLLQEKQHYRVFPPSHLIFNAFNLTPFDAVKVVILGQDPYHGEGQAHGLAFSVPDGVMFPPSLRNIFKELSSDMGCQLPYSGNLEPWARQGVLLLNASLTVRMNEAGSHARCGWTRFTDAAIKALSDHRNHLVFLLWGNYAAAKESLIDGSRHLVLKAAHPSPLAASRGFFGCRHFSKTNEYLADHGISPITWSLNI